MINEEFSFKMGIFEILKRTSEDHLPTIKWVNCTFNDGRVKGPADPPHPSNILYKEQNRNKKERDKEERKIDKIQLVAIREAAKNNSSTNGQAIKALPPPPRLYGPSNFFF